MKSDERFVLSSEEAEIVADNLDLVKWIVNHKIQWRNQEDFEDKVQIGSIGLIKAVKTFDKNRNLKFATYASTCIMNEIRMYGRKVARTSSRDISMEETIASNNSELTVTIEDILIDESSSSFEKNAEKREDIIKALMIILNCFSFRRRFFLLLNAAGFTKMEIANLVGISRSYANRLIIKYKGQMQEIFEGDYQETLYGEVFKVTMADTKIKISFSTNEVENFNQGLARFFTEMTEPKTLIDFEIRRLEGRVIIELPAEKASFALLAMLLNTIENFQMKCETDLVADEEQKKN